MKKYQIRDTEYSFTKCGKVFSNKRNKERQIKLCDNHHGLLFFNLFVNGFCYPTYIHRLLAEKFVPRKDGYNYVYHIDGDKNNNVPENLRWGRNPNVYYATRRREKSIN